MNVRLVALGHRMSPWVAAGVEEYTRRMPREYGFAIVELKPEPRDRGREEPVTEAGDELPAEEEREADGRAASREPWWTPTWPAFN